jgi:HMG-box domain
VSVFTTLQPKRNLSAYNMFVADHRPEIMAGRVSNAGTTANFECHKDTTTSGEPQTFLRIASEKWKNLDPTVKETYVQLARKEKERYKVELALWERENGGPRRRRSAAVRLSTSTPPISRVDVIAVDEGDRKSPVCLSSPPVQRNAIVIPKSPEVPVESDMGSCWVPLSCLPFHPSCFDDRSLITPSLEAMLPYHSRRDHFVTMDAPLQHSLRGLLSRSSRPDRCDSHGAHSSYHSQYDWELEQYKNQVHAAMLKATQFGNSRCEKILNFPSACPDQSDTSNSAATTASTEELDNSRLEPLSTKLEHDDFWVADHDPNFLADNADLLLSIFD